MRGRKPKPTHLRLIAGNAGKRKINRNEPKPRAALTEPPDWFNDEQREAWQYAIDNAPSGLLFKLDRSILVVWVVAEGIHREATEQLAQTGLLVRNRPRQVDMFGDAPAPRGAIVPSPLLGIMYKQANIMMRAAEQLGFSPMARSRVEVNAPAEDDEGRFFEE